VTLLLASVYHTGTRFCRGSLFSDFNFGSQVIGSDAEATNIHIEPVHIKPLQYWLNAADHVVVPLRHPLLVAESWKARGMELAALDEQWRTLADVVVPHDPIYLPIDHPDRDLYLKELNQRMGLDLETDWQPVGGILPHEIRNNEPLTDNERQQAERWAPLFMNLYG
jgi:hypothetical protein